MACGRPHPAASCPGSGEQRRPFGEGRRRTEGAGFPARVSGPAALSCGRESGAAGRSGRGRGRGPGVDPSRGGNGAPSQRAQGHGRDGAWRRGHVHLLCRPGLRVLTPARPEPWPSGRRSAETVGPTGFPLGVLRQLLARAKRRCLHQQTAAEALHNILLGRCEEENASSSLKRVRG